MQIWNRSEHCEPNNLISAQIMQVFFTKLEYNFLLRWLEIVSWRVRPGPLIACACASTPGSRRFKFSDLVTLENFAKFIFRSKISLKVDGENL